MPNNVAHFDVDADDLARARRFYERVFGWRFRPWGPPDFFLITTGSDEDPGIGGALRKRAEPVTGEGVGGYECTIAVDDVGAIEKAIVANGGEIAMPRVTIPSVGQLIKFRDTEGNLVAAMQYEPHVLAPAKS
jgi:predicted enzyme related to lactoylglutathione lyase